MKSVKKLISTLVMVMVTGSLLFLGAANSADNFVFGFEDLPLMEGLNQVSQDSVLFDTPQGRIVQASAVGMIAEAEVIVFYDSTLPQLGWTRTAAATYQREGEVLRLEFSTKDQLLLVAFLAEPSGNQLP